MESKLNQALTSKGSNNNSGGNGGGGGANGNNGGQKKRKCWNCGSEDHIASDPACPKYEKPAEKGSDNKSDDKEFLKWPAPAENQPKKKTVNEKGTITAPSATVVKDVGMTTTQKKSMRRAGWKKNKKKNEAGNMAMVSDWHQD